MSDTADTIEQKCLAKGVKLTEQRKIRTYAWSDGR